MLCKLFGHKSREHDYSGGEYMRVAPGAVDGILREHATLYATCPRCGLEYRAGQIHRPGKWNAPSDAFLAKQQQSLLKAYRDKP